MSLLGIKLLFAGVGAAVLAIYLYALRRVLSQRLVGADTLAVPGEIVDFVDEVVETASSQFTVTRLLVQFRPLSGAAVTAPTVTGTTGARRRYQRGQRVAVRYEPADPARFVVEGFDSGNRGFIIGIFGVLGLGLLGLCGLLYQLLTGQL